LNIDPETFHLEMMGGITIESEFYKISYNTFATHLDAEQLRWNNYFSEAENRNHFILSTHENHIRKYKGRRISP
jgi:hypothetical protein